MISLGILSTARINLNAILRPAQKNPYCQVSAIASRELTRAKKYAKSHDHIPKAFGNYQELLDDQDIDAVYISTPNALHEAWVEKALLAGKHVLCEKPLVTSPEKLKILTNLALEKNVFLMEAMHYRYHPILKDFFRLMDQRVLGKLEEAHVFLRYYHPSALNDIRLSSDLKGGSFMHLGCYCIDALTRIIPQPLSFRDIQILKQTDQVDLACRGILETPNQDIKASIYCDFSGHTFDSGIELKGEKGFLRLKSALSPTNFCHQNSIDTALIETNLSIPISLNNGDGYSTYDYQLNYFIDRIQKGQLTPEVNEGSSNLLIQGSEIISNKIKQAQLSKRA